MVWSERLVGNHLIYGIAPSKFKEDEIERLVESMLEKKTPFDKPLECVAGTATLWMPYYKIRIEYRRFGKESKVKISERVLADTALNAMFCGCVSSESELLMIFRPNYLRYEPAAISPANEEILGLTSIVDLEGMFSALAKKMNEVRDELSGLRSTLSKNYARKRRFSMLLPMGSLREERELSEKIAKLDALKNTISLCLNIEEEVDAVEFLGFETFYYPTSVFLLKDRETENRRFLVVNLVKTSGIRPHASCDISLTQLCNKNEKCRELVAAATASP